MGAKKEINQRIGANIKAVREESHYTQEQLSELIGVTPNHLSALERGYYGVTPELIDRLCHIFSVSADRLFFGADELDDFSAVFIQKLKTIPPNRKPQVYKIISDISELFEDNNDNSDL